MSAIPAPTHFSSTGCWMLGVRCWIFRCSKIWKHPTSNIQRSTSKEFSPVHLTEHDVHAAENDHGVGNPVAEAHIFQNRQVDETRRTHAVAIRIRRTVADEIKSELAFSACDE